LAAELSAARVVERPAHERLGGRHGQLRDPFGVRWAMKQPAAKAG